MAAVEHDERVTRDQIESKLREIQGEVNDKTDSAKSMVLVAGAAVVVVALGLGFMLGRRRGKKKTTIVEIQRV